MGTGSPKTSLSDYIAASRHGHNGEPCKFIREAPEEAVVEIDAVVAKGARSWAAMSRWLKDVYGLQLSEANVSYHYDRNHEPRQ